MQLKARPGTFKVSQKRDGGFVLAGVRQDGSRVRFKVGTLTEGHTLGRSLFQGAPVQPLGVVKGPELSETKLDEFGLPVDFKLPTVSEATVQAGAPPVPPTTGPIESPKKLERTQNAKSLAELISIAGAASPAYLANKFLEPRYENVPKPSKKHMNDLADELRAAITESFGDREVGHWTMVFLLALGIPVAMWIQASGPKKREVVPPLPSPNLQSVP